MSKDERTGVKTEAHEESAARFIASGYERFIAAAKSGNFTEMVNDVFAPNAVLMAPGVTLVGREQIAQGLQRSLAHVTGGWIRSDTVTLSGDLLYDVGRSCMTIAPAGETPVTVHGRYLTVWRRSHDEKWLVVADAVMRDP